jgi:serine phosphatase RsbU (regulator of sigma subunit)
LLRQQAGRPPAELVAACLDDVRSFTGDAALLDDLTVLAIRLCS